MIDLSKNHEAVRIESDGLVIPTNTLSVGPHAVFLVARTFRIGIMTKGRFGDLSIGVGRADMPCYASHTLPVGPREQAPKDDFTWYLLQIPRPEGESPLVTVPVFISHLIFYPAADAEQKEEEENVRRQNRIDHEAERWCATHQVMATTTNDPDYILTKATEIVRAIWAAVDDIDRVPRDLHPVDVLEKHIQRGNIVKDGKW